MQQSDLDGIARSGALARQRGASFHANPHYSGAAWESPQQMSEWHNVASAWAAGWLREDAGRDEAVAGLLRVRSW